MARQRARDRRPRKRVDDVVTLDKEYVEQMKETKEAESAEAAPSAEPEGVKGVEGEAKPASSAPSPEPDENAKTFGEQGKAWMTVEITEDHRQATLTALSFGGEEKMKGQAVVDALREIYHIHRGFKKKTLKEAIKKARKEGDVRGAFVIAKGKKPEPGKDGEVVLLFQQNMDVVLPYQAVKDALANEALEAVLEKEVVSALVGPGETLARITPPTEGTPGKDIFGKAIEEPGKEAELNAGANVTLKDGEFAAQSYGYVCLIKDEISVLSPIWVSPEFQEAHFVHFPQVRKAPLPQPEWIAQAAELAGVASGLDDEAVAKLCAKRLPATEKVAIEIAKSRPAVAGADAHVEYSFDPSKRAGNVLEDGTIDYRERNAAVGVAAGALIGELVAATPGESGHNVKGEEIPATAGEERTFTAGQNVRTEAKDGGTAFIAEIDGAVNVAGDTIEVQPVFALNGDVDYDSGNIDLPTNVDIGGSVVSGFSVKSGGV